MDSDIRTIGSVKIQNDLNSSREINFLEKEKLKPKKKFAKFKLIKNLVRKKLTRSKRTNKNINYTQSNCLSKLFFYWPSHIFKIANKGTLRHEDVCHVSEKQSIKYEIGNIKKTFSKYSKNRLKKYSLALTIYISNCRLLFLLLILDLINVALDYIRMFFYRQIISIFSEGNFFPQREKINFFNLIRNFKKLASIKLNIIESVSLYIIIKFIRTLIFNHIEFNNGKLTSKITNQMIALITEKIIRSNSYYKTGSVISEGEMLNLAEVDAERIGSFFFSGPRIITAPIKVVTSVILLFKIFGFYFLYVLIVLFILIVIISLLQIFYIKNLKKLLFFKDKRMKIVTYVFQNLKCLKLNSLDDEFIKRIKEKRENELAYLDRTNSFDMYTFIINSNINLILMIFTLYFFAYSKNEIEISNLFVAFQLINSMTLPLLLIPFFFNRLFSNLLSLRRVQNFLKTEEYEIGKYQNKEEYDKDVLIKFDNISFGLHQNQLKNKYKKKKKRRIFKNILNTSSSVVYPMSMDLTEIKSSVKIKPKQKITIIYENENILLNNIFFSVKKSEFVAIVGSMGSGKSSLINAILNNFKIYLKGPKPIINGEISYCPQTPWITTDTIKNNILFYNKYNPDRYKKIISLCQLENDFKKFVDDDDTLINSSSANLSGGQKARIALARCLYKEADLYLFDDPFSAIDNSVKQAIFENSFCDFLKDKARILVTNDLTNLINVDKIIYMKKGSIIFTGTFDEYKKYFSTDNLTLDFIKRRKNDEDSNDSDSTADERKNNKLNYYDVGYNNENDEVKNNPYINKYFHSNKGNNVSWKTYLDYIKLQGGYILFFILLLLIIGSRIIESYRRTFIPSLTKSYKELKEKKDINTNQHFSSTLQNNLPWYIKISLAGFAVNFLAEFIIDLTSIKSMRSIHEQMIFKLVKAPINLFHDIVPLGQIINHLTRDIEMVQDIVPQVNLFFKLIFSLLSALGLCYIYNKATLYFCPIVIISSFFFGKSYIRTGRTLTRLFRISFSPIMTILNESIKGVDIIRSSHMEENTMEKMYQKLDERYGISLYSDGSLRWYNLRRSISSQIYFGLILFYMVYYSDNYSAKSIAIILQTTEDFINLLVNTSMYLSKLEISMIGLERCKTLLKIETEKNPEKDITQDLELKHWPNEGKINFINVSTSYRPDTPLVLKEINFEIKPGEKIGVVGRTGSGKSSLVLSLCRMIEPKLGKILIDGEDIKNINLEFLRDKLSIVSQDPFLIETNVRDNIDPLNKYTDEEILQVMDDFGIFKKMGKEKLKIKIKENGKNLSSGEKQLINFARAIIKKNKIIILDEATSSLDIETEKIIQKNMRHYFKDSTVIMIAHHLQMVQGCQTILVIDNGQIIEMGSYHELLNDKNSKFYSLYIREEEND